MYKKIVQAVALCCLYSLFANSLCYAKKLYRWTDDNGNTYFSDQIPPEHSGYRRDSLSKQGRVLEVTERARTREQLVQEKRLAELRKEQEKLIANQHIHDKALLSTYRSKDDLTAALNVKLDSIDSEKKVIEGNLTQLKDLLAFQQKDAATFERNGQKVPKKSLADMRNTQAKIKKTEELLVANADKKQQVTREFQADINRFLYLTQTNLEQESKVASITEANRLGLFYCHNDHQCNKAWEIGHKFVNFYSTTPPDIYNDKLIMSRPPAKDTDLSLSLSKIALNEEDYQLFLDIRCRESTQGRQLCASEKISQLRSSFRPYINNALSRSAQ